MFTTLRLQNFRKCRDSSMSFGPGLNVIRGLNESSKSTRFEAMAYAMFGSDALREPLADVVTWGERESSLKVELEFEINTAKLRITRGKSGAEIFVDGKLSATGQKEVTRFVEQMLGAPPKVAGKLMLANQSSLRGALSDGPTATAQLIEQLANFSMIDEIIQLVQEKLPCGATTAIEQQITTLSGQLGSGAPAEPDLSAFQVNLMTAREDEQVDQEGEAECRRLLPVAKTAADAFRLRQKTLSDARSVETQQLQLIATAQAAMASLKPESTVTEDEVAALRAQLAGTDDLARAKQVHARLKALPMSADIWDDTPQSFQVARTEAAAQLNVLEARLHELTRDLAVAESQRITETACGLCGKDLQNVPEVVTRNAATTAKVQQLGAELTKVSGERAALQADVKAYQAIADADGKLSKELAAAGAWVQLSHDTVPPTWQWVGPDLSQEDPAPALKAKIEAGSAELRRAAQHQGQQAAQQSVLAAAEAALKGAREKIAELEPKVSGDQSAGLERDLETKLRYHQGRLQEHKAAIEMASTQIAHATSTYQVQVAAYQRTADALEAAQQQLEETQLNNVLVRKLRAARPRVADKLWSTILSTVSYYFSGIRGVQSLVTRDDEGFKVDSKPVTGLSGSTLDALGLGIRIALTKTFLPNNDFMVLDEPGAACDDEREGNMLGVLAASGFAQVLLVTHSPMADVFADQVVTL